MEIGDLTPAQRAFLDRVIESELADTFYLSGGTALSAFHLHHRRSDDLDLFSRHRFDSAPVVKLVNAVAEEEPVPRRVADRLGFLVRVAGEPLRVEFVHYDFDWLDPPIARYGRLRVDGLRDILANKLSAMVERTDPKDYADLLHLLRRTDLTIEQGMRDCRTKFGWPGLPHLLQIAFLRVNELSGWPETEPPTTLDEARIFFRGLVESSVRLSI
ncbi:MAG TPA: nucleotidyl transferase AbiEii/AbiGii toxin family protein [Thermoanaerobaculia bacterium]|nr:nucleotidyl transferase AbiEii/AbiGii toxin family protein [Thermoanaerobaculia bacterium]